MLFFRTSQLAKVFIAIQFFYANLRGSNVSYAGQTYFCNNVAVDHLRALTFMLLFSEFYSNHPLFSEILQAYPKSFHSIESILKISVSMPSFNTGFNTVALVQNEALHCSIDKVYICIFFCSCLVISSEENNLFLTIPIVVHQIIDSSCIKKSFCVKVMKVNLSLQKFYLFRKKR